MINYYNAENYSQRIAWVMVEGVKEVVGVKQLEKVVTQTRRRITELGRRSSPLIGTNNFEMFTGNQILEGLFGTKGAIGIARRAGMASFQPFLHAYAREAGFEDLEFRLLPPRQRMINGLINIAGLLTREGFPTIQVRTTDSGIIWSVWLSKEELLIKSQQSLSQFFIGFLQEYLGWVSGGKFFMLDDLAPVTNEENVCAIKIDPRPLD